MFFPGLRGQMVVPSVRFVWLGFLGRLFANLVPFPAKLSDLEEAAHKPNYQVDETAADNNNYHGYHEIP